MSSRVSRSKGKASRTQSARADEGSQPDVQISYAAVGHETMAAIAEELAGDLLGDARGASPEISVAEGPVGRETLALITDLARQIRPEQSTLTYGDRISNAPGAKTPSKAPPPRAAAEVQRADDLIAPVSAPFAIFEMLTFVVQGPEIAHLASEALRRRFVEDHLLRRIPNQNMDHVERVDVTPWTVRGTVVVRVWCKI